MISSASFCSGVVAGFSSAAGDRAASGDCGSRSTGDGDSGSVDIQYVADAPATYNIVCAHYSGNRRMAFDYFDTTRNTYVVVFIVDGNPGPDKLYLGSTTDATLAKKWVNLGWAGSGARTAGRPFEFGDPAGDSSVEA